MAQVLTIEPDKTAETIRRARDLSEANELDQAFEVVQEFLAKHPNDAQMLVIGAMVLKKAKKTPIAYSLAKRATEIKPDRAEPWHALGHCAQALWMLDDALDCYRKACSRTNDDAKKALFLCSVGSVHLDAGRFSEAEDVLRQSVKLKDSDHYARHNLGLALLGQRKWRDAWPYYSASVGTFNRLSWKYQNPPEPQWDGTKGQRVVVFGEQGLGDEISFASMIPDVCRDAGVILDCDKRLKGLFARSFPKAKVYGTRNQKQLDWAKEDRTFDASISMGELGRFYRNDAADFPGTPYLTPCPDRTAGWKAIVRAKGKPTIGIAWTGGTWENGAMNRNLPLDQWAPIFNAVDAHWVSLQYKDASQEIAGTPVTQYPWATLSKDYDDTAALVAACDLVISMQTAVAHLAGALGVPVWTLVPKNSQWRYGENGEDMPWYRSMRVFKAKGSWAPVVQKVAQELKEHAFAD